MPNKPPKEKRKRSSSSNRTTSPTRRGHLPNAATDELSAQQIEEILDRARQTVKPLIKREAANEFVGEDVLNFKMA